MNVYVYPTDRAWYEFLARQPDLDEINFWRPGGRLAFKQLKVGDLFLFRLGAPHNAIAGGGFFTHFTFAPLSVAWDLFGRKNGTADFETFARAVAHYRRERDIESVTWAQIGNIILSQPFFWARGDWLSVPDDYQVNSPQGRRFDGASGSGLQLLEAVQARFLSRLVRDNVDTAVEFGESLVRRRLGQGAFSLIVSDAYEKRCAITGEKTLPVLEAAHIKPVAKGGFHGTSNGLFLRSDVHKLFDRGYVTVQPNGLVLVSPKLRADWSNGVVYYAMHGKSIRTPVSPDLRPSPQLLEWHNDVVFKG